MALSQKQIEALVQALGGGKKAAPVKKDAGGGRAYDQSEDKLLFDAGHFTATDGNVVKVEIRQYKGYAPKLVVTHGDRRVSGGMPIALEAGNNGTRLDALREKAREFIHGLSATGT
jgi:hypothetical protein